MIPVEKQVTSLEPSKRLKELGLEQDSVWYWVLLEGYFDYKLVQKGFNSDLSKTIYHACSAFTVAELGELLPDWADFTQKHYNSTSKETWYRCYTKKRITLIDDFKEADARARMLIHLIENKLMGVNK